MNDVVYYYLRDENNQPYGCVAIIENEDGTINRGVSLCSVADVFKKDCARGIAFKRLNDSYKIKKTVYFEKYLGDKSTCPISLEDVVNNTKMAHQVKPTDKEYRMLHKPDFIQ
jgi:hypothetical protein